MERLPSTGEVERDLRHAAEAVASGKSVRRRLRRRSKRHDPNRQETIRHEVRSMEEPASILRSHLKRSDHHDRPYTPSLRRTIKRLLAQLRYERRQLRKMLPRDELT